MNSTESSSNGSYYGTIRTLRNLLLSAAPVQLPAAWTSTGVSSEGEATIRARDTDEQQQQRQPGKKRSRPGIQDLFSDAPSPVVDGHGVEKSITPSEVHAPDASPSPPSIDRTLFQAGTSASVQDTEDANDMQQLPLLVLCPCNLPDGKDRRAQDAAVGACITRLEEYAQAPYLLVLFASPSPTVHVQQLIAYYRQLSPDARRNVKRMWIVHPGLVTRMCVCVPSKLGCYRADLRCDIQLGQALPEHHRQRKGVEKGKGAARKLVERPRHRYRHLAVSVCLRGWDHLAVDVTDYSAISQNQYTACRPAAQPDCRSKGRFWSEQSCLWHVPRQCRSGRTTPTSRQRLPRPPQQGYQSCRHRFVSEGPSYGRLGCPASHLRPRAPGRPLRMARECHPHRIPAQALPAVTTHATHPSLIL